MSVLELSLLAYFQRVAGRMKGKDSDTEVISRWCGETGSLLLLHDVLRSDRGVANRVVTGCLGITPGAITSVACTRWEWNEKSPTVIVETQLYHRPATVLFTAGETEVSLASRLHAETDRYIVALPFPGSHHGGENRRVPPGLYHNAENRRVSNEPYLFQEGYGGVFYVEWDELHDLLREAVDALPDPIRRLVRNHREWIGTLPRGNADDDQR
jgi:hypothetical protein